MHKTLKELTLLTPAQTEKELRTAPWLRSIRLDVYALDKELSVYSTEMQKEYRNDLVKRSRYYQSLIDSPLLEPGSVNFNQLNNTYMILIMPFDLFGLGRYCYTFQNYCREEKALERQAGSRRQIGRESREYHRASGGAGPGAGGTPEENYEGEGRGDSERLAEAGGEGSICGRLLFSA